MSTDYSDYSSGASSSRRGRGGSSSSSASSNSSRSSSSSSPARKSATTRDLARSVDPDTPAPYRSSKVKSRGGGVVTDLSPPVEQRMNSSRSVVGNPRRRCTDVFFLLLFFAMFVGLAIVTGFALDKGDPQKIYFPMDSQGNLCGRNNVNSDWVDPLLRKDLSNARFLYFPNPLDLNVTRCLSACPNVTTSTLASLTLCNSATPTMVAQLGLNCICTYSDGYLPNRCFPAYASKPIARRCVPSDLTGVNASIKRQLYATTAFFQRFWSSAGEDGGEGWKLIASAFGFAAGLSIVWILLMFIFAPLIVWFTVTLGWCGMALGSAWLIVRARTWTHEANLADPKDPNAIRNAEALTVTSWVVLGAVVIFFFIIIFMIKRIQIAIGVIRVSSKAVGSNPSVFISPFLNAIWNGAIICFGLFVGCYLYSAGKIVVYSNSQREFIFDQRLKGAIVYWAFGLSWWVFFNFGAFNTATAMVVSRFYFDHPQPVFAFGASLGTTLFYHSGSIAFGSLLIAIVFAIRVAFQFVKQQMKTYIKNNPGARLAVCCIDCCLACFQRFLEFLTNNAYVQIAIHGTPFCTSARRATKIILDNPARVAAVTGVSALVLFLGKVFVAALTTIIVQEILTNKGVERNYVIFFVLFTIGYVVAYVFFTVYNAAIRATLQCFIEDESQNGGAFSPPYLKKYMTAISGGGKFA